MLLSLMLMEMQLLLQGIIEILLILTGKFLGTQLIQNLVIRLRLMFCPLQFYQIPA